MRSLLIIIALISTLFNAQAQENNYVKVGDKCPKFTVIGKDGKQIKSTDLKGKVVLVSFFATWCPPCQKELAAIEQTLYPKYKVNEKFALIVVGREHSEHDLKKYNEKKNFSFPLYPDRDRAIYGKFAKQGIPRTYLIGKDGKIIFAHSGYSQPAFEKLMAEIEKAFK